jgi:hypothetical protein
MMGRPRQLPLSVHYLHHRSCRLLPAQPVPLTVGSQPVQFEWLRHAYPSQSGTERCRTMDYCHLPLRGHHVITFITITMFTLIMAVPAGLTRRVVSVSYRAVPN